MVVRVLTLREVNRATLARQLLLERSPLTAPAAIKQLVGLQAQQPISPYIGLWTRLNDFQRDNLAQLIQNRAVVKATLMRSTLHLATADDYLLLRATLQPMMTSGWEAIAKRRNLNFDVKMLVAAAKDYLSEQPRTFAEISAMLTKQMPDSDVGAMRYGVRTHLPLVQVPIDTTWSYPGNPQFALAEAWLNQPIPDEEHLRTLVFRYLAAFGPASVADLQTWSGLGKLKASVETLNLIWSSIVTRKSATCLICQTYRCQMAIRLRPCVFSQSTITCSCRTKIAAALSTMSIARKFIFPVCVSDRHFWSMALYRAYGRSKRPKVLPVWSSSRLKR